MHNLKDNRIRFGIFVVCLVVGFEDHEFDSHVMRIVSVLCKLNFVSMHILIICVATLKLDISICYVQVDVYY
jgi:hypothetical protein